MSSNANNKKVGLVGLTAIIVTTIIGGGVFNISSDMARHAGIGSILLSWIITGVGMMCLALTYQHLSSNKPALDGGIYSYAKAGFGEFVGFNTAWGFWLGATLGNVAYVILLSDTLSYFYSGFNNKVFFFIYSTAAIWLLYFVASRGVKTASIVNNIVTLAKLIPIALFIIIGFFFFDYKNLSLDFWGQGTQLSFLDQLKSTMLVTVWVFIGIEGAVVISAKAKHKKDVGAATIIGSLFTLMVYVLITLVTLAAIPRAQVAGMPNPSLAYALEAMIGKTGAILMNVGLIISIFGSLLGWLMLAAEIPFITAKDKLIPEIFGKENSKGAPTVSLFATSLCANIFILFAVFFSKGYQFVYFVSSVCHIVPYFFNTLYDVKIIMKRDVKAKKIILKDFLVASISLIYIVWLFSTCSDQFLGAAILYAIGMMFFVYIKIKAKKVPYQGY